MNPLLIYIAGKYSAKTREEIQENIDRAEEFGKQVLLAGHIPVMPHRLTAHWDLCSKFTLWGHSDWMEKFCLPLLRRCDAGLFMPGWTKSEGSKIEFYEAIRMNKAIFFEIKELPHEI